MAAHETGNVVAIFCAVLVFGQPTGPGSAQAIDRSEPLEVVDALQAALIDVATDSSEFSARFETLAPVVSETHDFAAIARLVGGRFWRQIDGDQRARFTDAFRRASVATYAKRFTSADRIDFDPAMRMAQRGARAQVRSILRRTDGDPITFEYTLQQTGDRWLIVTVLVDGVSDLALQRAELSRQFEEAGFDSVVENLESTAAGGTLR